MARDRRQRLDTTVLASGCGRCPVTPTWATRTRSVSSPGRHDAV